MSESASSLLPKKLELSMFMSVVLFMVDLSSWKSAAPFSFLAKAVEHFELEDHGVGHLIHLVRVMSFPA